MPCSSSARSRRRSYCWPSRGSPTKRYALASAAGPMKSGSTSIDRQSDTHAPHWMHALAAAEDERVEQRIRPEAVAAVDGDARDLAGRVQARNRRRAVDVGLDA